MTQQRIPADLVAAVDGAIVDLETAAFMCGQWSSADKEDYGVLSLDADRARIQLYKLIGMPNPDNAKENRKNPVLPKKRRKQGP